MSTETIKKIEKRMLMERISKLFDSIESTLPELSVYTARLRNKSLRDENALLYIYEFLRARTYYNQRQKYLLNDKQIFDLGLVIECIESKKLLEIETEAKKWQNPIYVYKDMIGITKDLIDFYEIQEKTDILLEIAKSLKNCRDIMLEFTEIFNDIISIIKEE